MVQPEGVHTVAQELWGGYGVTETEPYGSEHTVAHGPAGVAHTVAHWGGTGDIET